MASPSPSSSSNADAEASTSTAVTFESLGVSAPLCAACAQLNYAHPTPIQAQSLPYAIAGRDLIGLAQTGSGKTAAFAIPVLMDLWENPRGGFACVLAPTRELAYQISETFNALGAGIGVRVATIVGGMDMMQQSVSLAKKPHIIVATPGRLQDHLENTKGFSLRNLKYLIMDEADRLLDLDFGPIIDKILKVLPREERTTYLFSATMTTKVAKLQRASLRDPVKVEVSSKYETVSTLLQYYLLVPSKHKDLYLVHLLASLTGSTIILFTRTVHDAARLSLMLAALSFSATPLHGQLSQSGRLAALNAFKSGKRKILVATDVASRGLDIPSVDVVLNYDVPSSSKDYIHRVGRTARAGKGGKAVTFVTQYDVEVYQRIEGVLGRKLDEWQVRPSGSGEGSTKDGKEEVLLLAEKVGEAQRAAAREIKEFGFGGRNAGKGKKDGKGKRRREEGREEARDRDDDEVEAGMGGGSYKGSGGGGKKRRR